MQIWNLPAALATHSNRLFSVDSPLQIILYQAQQETRYANIQFTQNAIIFLLNGYKEVMSGTRKINLKAGEGFLIRQGNYLMTEKPAQNGNYESLMFFFPDTVVPDLTQGLFQTPATVAVPVTDIMPVPAADYLQSFQVSVKSYFTSKPNSTDYGQLLKIKMQELFWLMTQTKGRENFRQWVAYWHKPHANSLKKLVQEHYKENISLAQLAFLGGYSLSTFKRRFEEIYHTTPRKWLTEKRLQEAYFLLKSTELNVSEVSREVGFENVSHFGQAFKERFGQTPKQLKVAGLYIQN